MAYPTPTQHQTARAAPRLPWGWRGLVWVCCLLTLFATGPFPLTQAPALAGDRAPIDPVESEERAPVEEDDEGTFGEKAKEATRGQSERSGSRRHKSWEGIATSWLAHLPHHHVSTPGYHLPACTPFEWGARLPLRC